MTFEEIQNQIEPFWRVTVRDCVSSTNTVLKAMAAAGAPAGCVLIARRQTAGKGRMGRSFFAPDGGAYLSLLLRPALPAAQTSFFTVAAAVAAARACETVSPCKAEIKWVNDLYVNGKKVCGILGESALTADGDKPAYLVLGVGVNVRAPKGGFPPDIARRAGALPDTPTDAAPRFCAAFLNEMSRLLPDFTEHAFLPEYRRRCFLLGQTVTLWQGDRSFTGTAVAIDDNAALCLRLRDGSERAFSAGEVTFHP